MQKRGFTIAEMVITLGVIATVALILIPVLQNTKADENVHKYQKALFLSERLQQELLNDEDLYKDANLGDTEEVSYEGRAYSGNTKFCELFASRMKTMAGVSCAAHRFTDGEIPQGTFTTPDGIVWNVPISEFGENAESIEVDVNGNKGPNCYFSESCRNPDRFTLALYLGKHKKEFSAFDVSRLRTTLIPGIYCEAHNPSRPSGDYSQLRHYYFDEESQKWTLLEGVYFVSSEDTDLIGKYPVYKGPDADKIFKFH